jgi:3-oxoadipate enol-lactonase
VAVGELDKPDFHQIAGRLGERIQGAESAVIEVAGHLPSLERPEATAPLVRAFLER